MNTFNQDTIQHQNPSTVGTADAETSSDESISSKTPGGHFGGSNSGMTIHRRHLLHIANDVKRQTRHTVPPKRRHEANHTSQLRRRLYSSSSKPPSCGCKPDTDWLGLVLPCTKWLRTYDIKSNLLVDVIAGCTVGVMIVPQSMSYAKLAGLPVEYGLYSSLVPVLTYALFGSSRQLAVGPVAIISLMLNTGLTHVMDDIGIPKDDPDYQEQYQTLAIQTSFLVGVAYLLMGLLRLGFVTIFLSHAVISGFTTGAAVIIGMSQLKHILGYDVENSKVLYTLLVNLIQGLDKFNYKTFLLGTSSVIMLLAMKHLGKTVPKLKWMRPLGPLTVTVVTIVLTVTLNLQDEGIPIVGYIPKGLPSFTGNLWTPIPNLNQLWVVVVSITIVGFMESIAIAKQLASKHKYELDTSQELMGLGMANFFGAMFHCYPITGSFSRSAVNNDSGAQSGISGMVTSILVGITLLLLTPIFEKLPLCVLAAIVISGVIGLLDYEEAMYLWKVHKFDFLVWMVACTGTMFLGVEIGLGIAVMVSLLLVLYESAVPHTAVLGRLPGSTVYRNVKQYTEAERYDGIVAVQIDAPIYFANTLSIREKLEKYERTAEKLLQERQQQQQQQQEGVEHKVKYIVLELSPVSHVDTSGLHILHDMLRLYKDRGIQLCFSNPGVQVMERFQTSGLAAEVGEEHIFVTMHDAMTWCLHELDTAAVSQHAGIEIPAERAMDPEQPIGDLDDDLEKQDDAEGSRTAEREPFAVVQI
jgi:sulfate transporter 4